MTRAAAVGGDVRCPRRLAGRLAVDRDPEPHRRAAGRAEHEVQVAGVEAVADLALRRAPTGRSALPTDQRRRATSR